ncbi:hypothetical protein HDV57DRAFT_395537 [Trichoderma longibrachiatum]
MPPYLKTPAASRLSHNCIPRNVPYGQLPSCLSWSKLVHAPTPRPCKAWCRDVHSLRTPPLLELVCLHASPASHTPSTDSWSVHARTLRASRQAWQATRLGASPLAQPWRALNLICLGRWAARPHTPLPFFVMHLCELDCTRTGISTSSAMALCSYKSAIWSLLEPSSISRTSDHSFR